MRKFIRKITLLLSSLCWSDCAPILLSLVALQHIACAYGTDEPCDDNNCYDPSLDCSPIFNYEAMTGKDYSECEQGILDTLKARKLRNTNEYGVCIKGPCNLTYEERWLIRDNCPLDHIKADSALSGYQCANGENVSIDEGERRSNLYLHKSE